MKKHVLISAAFTEGACESDFITCCALKLKELGLHVSMHTTPDCSVIMAAQPEETLVAPQLPVPAEEPVAAAEPAPVVPAPEPPAVEIEVETPAGELEVELPVKFEGRLLDLSITETVELRAGAEDVSELPLADLDLESVPGHAIFSMFGMTYKFPLDESGCITSTISVNNKTKRTKIKPVKATVEMLEPLQVRIGKSDAELLLSDE